MILQRDPSRPVSAAPSSKVARPDSAKEAIPKICQSPPPTHGQTESKQSQETCPCLTAMHPMPCPKPYLAMLITENASLAMRMTGFQAEADGHLQLRTRRCTPDACAAARITRQAVRRQQKSMKSGK